MKKVLSAVVALGCCLYLPTAVLAGGGKKVSDNDMSRELADLRAQLAKQQAEIDMLKRQDQKVDTTLSSRLEALEKKKGYVMAGNAFIDGVTLNGFIRQRYQINDYDGYSREDQNANRFRTTARLGGVWQNKAEDWIIGAGLATSTAVQNRGAEDTWGQQVPFEHNDLNLDYAYAKHTFGDYAVFLGQTPVPYTWSWVFMDNDLRPTGATAAYGKETGIFAMAGAYGAEMLNVDTGSNTPENDDTGMVYIAQAGYKDKFSEKGKFTLAVGYHMVDQAYMNEIQRDFFKNIPGLNGQLDNYSVEVGDLYGDVSFPLGPVSLKLYGQVWQNFAADTTVQGISQGSILRNNVVNSSLLNEKADDNDMGWSAGFSGNFDKVHFAYSYSYIEADSLYGGYVDSAIWCNTYTNVEGSKANIGYDITKNWAIDFTFYYFEPIVNLQNTGVIPSNVNGQPNVSEGLWQDATTYQFDVSYKF